MTKAKINTINIKGKEYATVDSRVEFFRENFQGWTIETTYPILDIERGVCVCKAVVKDDQGKIMADGYAHEWQSKPGSMVNKTSYIENAQTSAVGRALGFLGIGINGMGIATAEEVDLAIKHQEANDIPLDETIPEFTKKLSDQAYADIMAAPSIHDLVSVYNAYATSEPIQQLKDACALRRAQLEDEGMNN